MPIGPGPSGTSWRAEPGRLSTATYGLPVGAGRVDALACAAYTWLMSPRGTAFMTVSDRLAERLRPHSAGWYARAGRPRAGAARASFHLHTDADVDAVVDAPS